MIVAATGHRPEKCGGYGAAAKAVRVGIAESYLKTVRPSEVIVGMALGWDQDVALAALNLGLPYTAALPFSGQETAWPIASQDLYWSLVQLAAKVIVVSPGGYSTRAMHARNRWMVDRCDSLMALWNGDITGGTANCVVYAEKKGKPIVNLWAEYEAAA
jgi:uncharacterized phage-like protein YoqJ